MSASEEALEKRPSHVHIKRIDPKSPVGDGHRCVPVLLLTVECEQLQTGRIGGWVPFEDGAERLLEFVRALQTPMERRQLRQRRIIAGVVRKEPIGSRVSLRMG